MAGFRRPHTPLLSCGSRVHAGSDPPVRSAGSVSGVRTSVELGRSRPTKACPGLQHRGAQREGAGGSAWAAASACALIRKPCLLCRAICFWDGSRTVLGDVFDFNAVRAAAAASAYDAAAAQRLAITPQAPTIFADAAGVPHSRADGFGPPRGGPAQP